MPCAMSSLRGASGVVGCDRVVCPLVLHATTIAHLDVLLCTLLFFLLRAVLLCGAVCSACAAPVRLSCGVPCALPALPVVRLRGAVAVVCGCVLPLLSLPSVGVRYGVPCAPCAFLALIPGATPAPHMGCYMWVLYAPYICALFFFRLAIYDPFCTYNKKPAHGFRIWISKSRLEFSMFCFSFCGIFSR